MRKFFIVLCCVLIPIAVMAQERTGNITGTVVDKDGVPLPGVNLILTQQTIRAMTTQTTAEGRFRFLSLHPGQDYQIKAELQGFKTKIETGIIVGIGLVSNITVKMEQGTLEEQVTVVAQTPMVQAKKTTITTTVSYETLQAMPSARDPWVVLQMTPAIFIDRENVGGSETGQQSSFMARGSTTQEWTLDGVQITDLSSGGSPGYFDFDAFEEMQVTTGQPDVEHRSPGVVVNLVTRRGGNKTSLAGRFYLSDEKFQGKLTAEEVAKLGVPGYNHILDNKDFGFNAGGAFLKDKIWWWGSYAINNIKTVVATGTHDDSYLTNMDFKLNFQLIPQNRAEVFIQAGKKEKFGRSSSLNFPPGWNQYGKYHFGSPTIAIRDEHMFGDSLFASVRWGYTDAGFGMWPANDEKMEKATWWNVERALYDGGPLAGGTGGQTFWFSGRPHKFGVAQLQYFNDDIFGTSHEMKIGFEFNNNSATTVGYFYGGGFVMQYNFNTTQLDWNKDGKPDIVRDLLKAQYPTNTPEFGYFSVSRTNKYRTTGTDRLSAYFNDMITFGRFNLTLGVRADRANSWSDARVTDALLGQPTTYDPWMRMDSMNNFWTIQNQLIDIEAVKKIREFLPEKTLARQEPRKLWTVFSPRLGLTMDVFGDGKTIAKAAYSLFPGSGWSYSAWQPSGLGGYMSFYWMDASRDKKVQWDELYWWTRSSPYTPYRAFKDDGTLDISRLDTDKGAGWGGFDYYVPWKDNTGYYQWDQLKVSLSHDVSFSVERQLTPDMSVSGTFSYRRYGRYSRSRSYWPADKYPTLSDPGHIRNANDYETLRNVPDVLYDNKGKAYDPKDAKGRPWYTLKKADYTGAVPTDYSWIDMDDPGACEKYWGWDFTFNKRLSNKWMGTASFTWQTERTYWGDNYTGDPTNKWAYDGAMYGISLGGNSGKTGVNFFSRWMAKAMGLYQLPWDSNVSFTVSGHEGSYVSESFGITDYGLPNSYSQGTSMPTVSYDHRMKLPVVWDVNMKVEKMIKLGENARMHIAADWFNVINQTSVLRQNTNNYGTFRWNADGSQGTYGVPSATNYKPIEIMNPFTFRFGVRFQI